MPIDANEHFQRPCPICLQDSMSWLCKSMMNNYLQCISHILRFCNQSLRLAFDGSSNVECGRLARNDRPSRPIAMPPGETPGGRGRDSRTPSLRELAEADSGGLAKRPRGS